MTKSVPGGSATVLKYASLIILSLQNPILTISLRYSRIRVSKEDLFFSSTGESFSKNGEYHFTRNENTNTKKYKHCQQLCS